MPEKIIDESKNFIKSIFGGIPKPAMVNTTPCSDGDSNIGLNIMTELNLDEANTILVSASAPEVQAVVRQRVKSIPQMPQPSKTCVANFYYVYHCADITWL